MKIHTSEITTGDVVDSPMPLAPSDVVIPHAQLTTEMIAPKTEDLIIMLTNPHNLGAFFTKSKMILALTLYIDSANNTLSAMPAQNMQGNTTHNHSGGHQVVNEICSVQRTLSVSVCLDTCMVPILVANALPTLIVTRIAMTIGESSQYNTSANTPPTTLVNPSLVNSHTNWMLKYMPTNEVVSKHTPSEHCPTIFNCFNELRRCILHYKIRIITCPTMTRVIMPLRKYRGGFQSPNTTTLPYFCC